MISPPWSFSAEIDGAWRCRDRPGIRTPGQARAASLHPAPSPPDRGPGTARGAYAPGGGRTMMPAASRPHGHIQGQELSVEAAPSPESERKPCGGARGAPGRPGAVETPPRGGRVPSSPRPQQRGGQEHLLAESRFVCLCPEGRSFWEQAGAPVTPQGDQGSPSDGPSSQQRRGHSPVEPPWGEWPLTCPSSVPVWLQSGRRPPESCWCPRQK